MLDCLSEDEEDDFRYDSGEIRYKDVQLSRILRRADYGQHEVTTENTEQFLDEEGVSSKEIRWSEEAPAR